MAKPVTTVAEYLAGLPEDRRVAIEALRKVIRKNIDKPFQEGIQYGMVGYSLPHSVYPAGYHCDPKQPLPFASIASQKNHIGLYLFCVYTSEKLRRWFCEAWKKTGKKLDMGKSCVRAKKLEDIPLDVVGELFRRVTAKDFVASYEASLTGAAARRAAKKKATNTARKKTAKKKDPKRTAAKKSAGRRAAATGKKGAGKPAARKPAAGKKPAARKKPAAGKTPAARKKAARGNPRP